MWKLISTCPLFSLKEQKLRLKWGSEIATVSIIKPQKANIMCVKMILKWLPCKIISI